ncbi:MAG: HPr family phosphocarrier protein [Lysobacterales bacterium]
MQGPEAIIEVTVVNPLGLHARPSARLVQLLAPFDAQIWLSLRGREINAKSIMGLMMLAAPQGAVLRARAEGPQAQAAIDALANAFACGFEGPGAHPV